MKSATHLKVAPKSPIELVVQPIIGGMQSLEQSRRFMALHTPNCPVQRAILNQSPWASFKHDPKPALHASRTSVNNPYVTPYFGLTREVTGARPFINLSASTPSSFIGGIGGIGPPPPPPPPPLIHPPIPHAMKSATHLKVAPKSPIELVVQPIIGGMQSLEQSRTFMALHTPNCPVQRAILNKSPCASLKHDPKAALHASRTSVNNPYVIPAGATFVLTREVTGSRAFINLSASTASSFIGGIGGIGPPPPPPPPPLIHPPIPHAMK